MILSTFRNLIPFTIGLAILEAGDTDHTQEIETLTRTLSWLTFGFLIVFVPVLLQAISSCSLPSGSPTATEKGIQNRKAAIVLMTLFFFEVGLAPMQFDMVLYFQHFFPDGEESLKLSSWVNVSQELLVILIGCLTLLIPLRTHVKGVAIAVAFSSLVLCTINRSQPIHGNDSCYTMWILSYHCGHIFVLLLYS